MINPKHISKAIGLLRTIKDYTKCFIYRIVILPNNDGDYDYYYLIVDDNKEYWHLDYNRIKDYGEVLSIKYSTRPRVSVNIQYLNLKEVVSNVTN